MPITKSAKKALRQNVTRRARNTKHRKTMKDTIKTYRKLVSQKKVEEAQKMLPRVFQLLDKTVKTGVIKKNVANRLKSRLSKKISVKK